MELASSGQGWRAPAVAEARRRRRLAAARIACDKKTTPRELPCHPSARVTRHGRTPRLASPGRTPRTPASQRHPRCAPASCPVLSCPALSACCPHRRRCSPYSFTPCHRFHHSALVIVSWAGRRARRGCPSPSPLPSAPLRDPPRATRHPVAAPNGKRVDLHCIAVCLCYGFHAKHQLRFKPSRTVKLS